MPPQMSLSQDVEKNWLSFFFYQSRQSIRPVNNNYLLVFSETSPFFLCEKTP